MADHLRTELVIDALRMAARNYALAGGAIFHSDRGTQYTSEAFAAVAEELGIRRSVGRTGSCFDNALAESFNAALKVERVNRTVYPTREHARADVTRYIEVFSTDWSFERGQNKCGGDDGTDSLRTQADTA